MVSFRHEYATLDRKWRRTHETINLVHAGFFQMGPEILCDLWRVWREREVSSTERAASPGTRTDFSRSSLHSCPKRT